MHNGEPETLEQWDDAIGGCPDGLVAFDINRIADLLDFAERLNRARRHPLPANWPIGSFDTWRREVRRRMREVE